ncbi:tRNA (guanine46-N7-)-methyltransferase [Clostridiaceae bacterium JG1575]|nr:tRNA (guanine46-N7-)-methyltransferase [Clostridiaceae bacterium JG1575]
MRLRHKPWALPEMNQSQRFFADPFDKKGHWREEFGNDHPIDLEVGCGRGEFTLKLARAYPERNFIAMDLKNEVLVYGLRKVEEEALPNVRMISMKAEDLDRVFAPGEIQRLFINFANPWPKAGHNKRRLTHPRFLALYRLITIDAASVEFKTDDEGLYTDSLTYFPEAGFEVTFRTQELAADHPGNIQTEYEEKFRRFGMPIYRIDAKKVPLSQERMDDLLAYRTTALREMARKEQKKHREQRDEESSVVAAP